MPLSVKKSLLSKRMLISKLALVLFILLQYLQLTLCESNSEAKFSGLIAHSRLKKVQRSRQGHHVEILCRDFPNLCQHQLSSRLKKDKKKGKMCCREKKKLCRRKTRKRCKGKINCLINNMRKCRKQLDRCNKRKEMNRRPDNCRRSTTSTINDERNKYKQQAATADPTTTKAVVKKREKEICNHSNECEEGFCCARHQHVKICKPRIEEGKVCSRRYIPQKRSPDMYERCPCAEGLSCVASESRYLTCQITT